MLQQLLFLAQIRPFLAQICGHERHFSQNQAALKAILKEINR